MELLEKILITSHVVTAIISLLTGLSAAFFGKKGGKLHRQVGKVYFWCMFWVFISAMLIISLIRFNSFLMVIAVFSFYMAFSGYRVITIKRTKKAAPIDWIAAVVTMGFGIVMIGMGVNYLIKSEFSSILGYLCLFFGYFTTQTGRLSYKGFKNLANAEKMWWFFAHMNAMAGSLIASITAFLVQNGEIFKIPSEMSWVLWVLPALVGSPIISYWSRKYKAQFKSQSV
ncbi:hypothetical protein [Roseivirga misakiensis]|uniref:DUF2306 domain-containing protein n=1 Tax=Roseivirga misakiensis TaxID=1563681 RepID=A0A1E5T6L0_9BACT|nr:hypothetical protein [Roseivirga misakiensis]OEK06937.1 hypothetical protein BFP71_04585 [Roseivirga misakiensis]